MPFELNPNSPIPGEYESDLERSRRLTAEEAQGKAKQGPAVPERLKGPAGPPKPTSAQIANRPQLLNQEPAYVGGPASALTQIVNPLVEPIANFASMAGNDSIKKGWQGVKKAVSDKEGQILSGSSAGQAYQEAYKAGAGGFDDLTRGLVNLPTQLNKALTGKELYQPVNHGLVPENNTTAGQALRTLTRYALSSAIPVPGVGGAVGLGVKAAGMRFAEGFVQDFAAASGDTKDSTFIGSIPGLEFLQTNEKYNPIQNRTVVGIEGALANAGVPYLGAALRRVADAYWKGGKAALKTPEVVKDLEALDDLIPTLKYGGNPNELVTDGVSTLTRPPQPFTPPSTISALPSKAVTPSGPINFNPVDMSRKNIQSINFENTNGQPGFDLWFADKRFPALLPGTVKKVGKQGSRGRGYGNYIVVESIDPKTGEKVDVLYGHLADGGIKVKEGQQVVPGMELGTQGGTGRVVSEDGTIASVDFLAPAAKESKSMKPYKRFNELRQELAAQIGKGGISPGQASQIMSDVSKALPTGQADEALQEASNNLDVLTRKQAAEAGYEVSELIPVQPRNTPTEVMAHMIKNGDDIGVENSARKGYYSLTDAEARIIGNGDDAAVKYLQDLAKTANKNEIKALTGIGDQDLEKINADAEAQVKDFFGLDDEQFAKKMSSFMYDTPEGKAITNEGMASIRFALAEIASQASDLSKAGINADINGQSIQLNAGRLVDRGIMLMQLEKVGTSSRSSGLSSLGILGKESDPILTKAMKAQAEETSATEAHKENILRVLKQFRESVVNGDEDALDKFLPAMKALSMVGAEPKKQLQIWKTLAAAHAKNLDAAFTGSILSGTETQSRNFHGNLYQAFGHPALAYFGRILPGAENKQVREEAVAAFSASFDTLREFNQIIPKIWQNAEEMPDALGKEFVGYDQELSDNLARIKLKIEAGEVSEGQKAFYGLAIAFHNAIKSPLWNGLVRRTMGTADQFFLTVAGRQVAYRRAYMDTLSLMGDAPMTKARKDQFANLLEKQRKQHLDQIFDADGYTVLDPEAKKLGDAFTFRIEPENTDSFTKNLISLSEKPGMKVLGLTFVRTPAAIFKATAKFTPILSDILRKQDDLYKNGSEYYRAYVDGAHAFGWIASVSAYTAGWQGVITGAGPIAGQDRKSWLEAHDPFQVYLPNGAKLSYQGLEPVTTVLGTFADLGALSAQGAERPLMDNFMRVIGAFGSNVINKSYLTQISALSQVLTADSPKEWTKLMENMATGLVPWSGMRNQLGKIPDPVIREARSSLLNWPTWFAEKKGGLGLSRLLPENLDDVTGKPLYRDGVDGAGSYLLGAFNELAPLGVRVSKNRFKPVHKYLSDLGIDVSDSKRKLLGQELTNEEMTQYTQFMTQGGHFEKALMDYFKSDQFKFDKQESILQTQQGYKQQDTQAYLRVQGIINSYASMAMQEMNSGLTDISAGFVARRSTMLKQAREADYQRNDRRLQQLADYPFK
jgi:hypothetical protein